MKITISMTLDDSIVEKLDRMAEKDMRSRSNMMEILIVESDKKENNKQE